MKSCLESSKLKVSMQERKSFDFPPKVLYENRYCNQNDFSVFVCGKEKTKDGNIFVLNLLGPIFQCEYYTSMSY